jgi:hypothetical protein
VRPGPGRDWPEQELMMIAMEGFDLMARQRPAAVLGPRAVGGRAGPHRLPPPASQLARLPGKRRPATPGAAGARAGPSRSHAAHQAGTHIGGMVLSLKCDWGRDLTRLGLGLGLVGGPARRAAAAPARPASLPPNAETPTARDAAPALTD